MCDLGLMNIFPLGDGRFIHSLHQLPRLFLRDMDKRIINITDATIAFDLGHLVFFLFLFFILFFINHRKAKFVRSRNYGSQEIVLYSPESHRITLPDYSHLFLNNMKKHS